MAKRFTDQVAFQPRNTSTGFVQGANTLLNRLQNFKSSTERLVGAVETKRGESEAQQAISDGKEFRKKKAGIAETILTGGIATNQYNRSLQAAYLSGLRNDTREAFAGIESENSDDISLFNDKITGYANGVLKEVDPSVRSRVSQFMDNEITDARIRVGANTIKKQQAIADEQRTIAIEGASDAAIRSAREGNPTATAESLLEAKMVLDSFVGQNGIDQASADFTFNQIQKRVAIEGIRTNVRTTAAQPGGVGEVANQIREFRENPLKGFTVAEQEDIYSTLVSDLNQTLALRNKEEDAENEFVIKTQDTKSEALYLGIVTGVSTASDVTAALASKEINQQQASTLINLVNNTGTGMDDWTLINSIEEDIRNGASIDAIRQTISTNTGSRLTSETGRALLAKVNEFQDVESPLKTNTAQRAEDFIISSMRVTGPLGSLDSKAERRLAIAKREYATRVLSGEDPFVVADGLVDTDQFARAPRPQFGTKDDLDGALTGLNAAMGAGTIDDDTYNREWNKIETLKQLKANIAAFNAAKKEHLNGIN